MKNINLIVNRSQPGVVRYYSATLRDQSPFLVFVYDPTVGPEVIDECGMSVVVCLYDRCQFPSEHLVTLQSPQLRYGTLLTRLLTSGYDQHKELIILNDEDMQMPLSFLLENVQSVDVVLVDIKLSERNFLDSLRKVLSRSDSRKFIFLGTPPLVKNVTHLISDLMPLVADTIWLLLDTQGVLPICNPCDSAINILRDDYVQQLETTIESVVRRVLNTSQFYTEGGIDQLSLRSELKQALISVQHEIQIFQPGFNGTLAQVGVWNNVSEASGRLPVNFTTKHEKLALRVVTIHHPPYIYKTSIDGVISYRGYAVELLSKIAEASGVQFIISECTTTKPFLEATVFAWNECITDIVSGRADMVIGPIGVTKERGTMVDFILPYIQYDSVQMLTRAKKGRRFDFLEIFDHWSMLVWLSCFIFTSVTLWIYENVIKRLERRKNPDVKYCSFQDVVWFIVTKAEFECDGIRLSRTSTKLMGFGFWLLSFILLSAFTANLASFMTVYRMDDLHVKAVSDLVTTKDVKFSVVWGSDEMVYFENMMKTEEAFHDLWKSSNLYPDNKQYAFNEIVWDYPVRDTFTKIWQSMSKTGFFNSTSEALRRVAEGNFILLSKTETVKYLISQNCDVKSLGSPMGYHPVGFALKKDSSLLSTMSNSFMEIQQSSDVESLKRKWWENRNLHCDTEEIIQEIGFTEIGYWFLTPVFGISLGILILGMERIVRYRISSTAKYTVRNGYSPTQHYRDNDGPGSTQDTSLQNKGFSENRPKNLTTMVHDTKDMPHL
ncbi:Glutamate receptor ionotropic, kainate 4 [Mizuhopecten yessoensis]|uniref:Glutamate receptor ionotropic, kainate 4 n=1 Tax=Mizuhopecten yessoensis TaxID=6573 RepID=A0A210PN30_MIZYE|nr:Glutamate receptor ionotropic, kainate 4 [Mizuhopecten yessoensis]